MQPKPTVEFYIHVFRHNRRVIATLESPGDPGSRLGHPDSWIPPEAPEVSYKIVDNKGQQQTWLEEALTPGQVDTVVTEATRRLTQRNNTE